MDSQRVERFVSPMACGTNARAYPIQVSDQRETRPFSSSRETCKSVACVCEQPLIL